MKSNMLYGSYTVIGDSNIPGIKMSPELEAVYGDILRKCTEFGLDYFMPSIEILPYDEISEIASYGGFPVRYPHWSFGLEYEKMAKLYEYGFSKIYEMVINNDPAHIYCLSSNTMLDNVLVISHAIGHSDFFKNNIFFEGTNRKAVDMMANHGVTIRRYIDKYGKERVNTFIDHVHKIDNLISPFKPYKKEVEKKSEEVEYVESSKDYMFDFLNPKELVEKRRKEIEKQKLMEELEMFQEPIQDIVGFLANNAPLRPWQLDILHMLYEEAVYFHPQGQTKIINEGWASYVDHCLMTREGMHSLGQPSPDAGILEYAIHKAGVLGGKYSTNPYKLGYELFLDIEDRWNKGKFGPEYDNCTDMNTKINWDKKLNLGKEKVFEVRKSYNDYLFVQEFFTEEFCNKNEFFKYQEFPDGSVKIVDKSFKEIKKELLSSIANRQKPDIRITDSNGFGKGFLMLQHFIEEPGLELYERYIGPTMISMYNLWQHPVVLSSFKKDGEEVIYICANQDIVQEFTRNKFDKFTESLI